jgi:hypothetical protein
VSFPRENAGVSVGWDVSSHDVVKRRRHNSCQECGGKQSRARGRVATLARGRPEPDLVAGQYHGRGFRDGGGGPVGRDEQSTTGARGRWAHAWRRSAI